MEILHEHHLATIVRRISEWMEGDIKNKHKFQHQTDVGDCRPEWTAGDFRFEFGEICEKDNPDWCELLVNDGDGYFLFGMIFTNKPIDLSKYKDNPDWSIISTFGDGKDIGADRGFTIHGEYNTNPNDKSMWLETKELDNVLDYLETAIVDRIRVGSKVLKAENEAAEAELRAEEKAHLDALQEIAGLAEVNGGNQNPSVSRKACDLIYKRVYADSLKGIETDFDVIMEIDEQCNKEIEAERNQNANN